MFQHESQTVLSICFMLVFCLAYSSTLTMKVTFPYETSVEFQLTIRRYIVTVAVKLIISPCSLHEGEISAFHFDRIHPMETAPRTHWVGGWSPGGSGEGSNLCYYRKSHLGSPARKLTSYFTNQLSRFWSSPYISPHLTLMKESLRSCQSISCSRNTPSLMQAKSSLP
jgi:hypothetical protein